MPFTTRGLALLYGWGFRGVARPTNFYLALVTAAAVPAHDTKTMAALTEIAATHGYTAGGYALTPNTTDFPTLTEDDTNQFTELALKTIAWTAAAGDIPASGDPASYVVLTTDEGTPSTRQVIFYAILAAPVTVLSGQVYTIAGLSSRILGGPMIRSIQRGTITFTGTNTTNTATISSVTAAKSSIRHLGHSNTSNLIADVANTRLALTNATTVTATRTTGSVAADVVTMAFEVVEYF